MKKPLQQETQKQQGSLKQSQQVEQHHATQEIERVSGTQLDPAIVNIFQQVVAAEPEWITRFSIRREKLAA